MGMGRYREGTPTETQGHAAHKQWAGLLGLCPKGRMAVARTWAELILLTESFALRHIEFVP